MFSVVIPAHNEERVLARLLRELTDQSGENDPGSAEIVVVCNGCTDGTEAVARSFSPTVTVLSTDVPSKPRALNLGDAAVTNFPRCYVDADVRISRTSLQRLVDAVQDPVGPIAAVPVMSVELTGRNWVVRSFYSVWMRLPFFTDGLASAGVYVLSQSARARFAEFPDLLGDDHYVLSRFSRNEVVKVDAAHVVIEAPYRAADIIRIKSRVFLGDRQLARTGLLNTQEPGRRSSWIRVVARRPRLWPAGAVYLALNLVAELRARGQLRRNDFRWERDGSSRAGHQ